ncbi:hypothetical protein PUN28_010630 [Cardiocondyla obscurior]|uniref:Uncharacterized protein n=1 Tax=Cardiocondyla obscurior TaxID=286306 RepID=A0AAW2FI64_9HYME
MPSFICFERLYCYANALTRRQQAGSLHEPETRSGDESLCLTRRSSCSWKRRSSDRTVKEIRDGEKRAKGFTRTGYNFSLTNFSRHSLDNMRGRATSRRRRNACKSMYIIYT